MGWGCDVDVGAAVARGAVWWSQVDAFAAEPFKGNPAAVCLLGEEAAAADQRWMQSVAAEFNLSETAFLVRDSSSAGTASAPRFHLRWFTPVAEVELCGHATLASAHFLFTSVLARHDMVEFATKSGILTAEKVPAPESTGVSGEEEQGKLFIELDFPMVDLVDCNSAEVPSIPETHWPAPAGYDFFTRFFCPKFGIDEDPVCGSAHCFLAPYWGGKLGKQKLMAFQASPSSGTLYLELDHAARRVRIQGEAVTVMAGTLLA